MNEQEIIQAEKLDIWFMLAEFCEKLVDLTGTLNLYFIPTLLFVAVFVFIFGGNVPGVFLGLFIVEAVGWTLFGLFALLRKHCMKKVHEYGW